RGCLVRFFSAARAPPALPSFPTRRSSDLFCLRGSSNDQTIAQRRNRSFELVDVPGEIKHHFQLEDAFWDSDAFARLSFRNFCQQDRKSTRLNSSHVSISYAVFCLKKKRNR